MNLDKVHELIQAIMDLATEKKIKPEEMVFACAGLFAMAAEANEEMGGKPFELGVDLDKDIWIVKATKEPKK